MSTASYGGAMTAEADRPVLVAYLDLGAPPKSGNRALRQHWAARRREAAAWRARVLAAVQADERRAGYVPRASPCDRRRVVIRWTAPRPLDADNALAACKPIVDALLARRWRRRKVGQKMVAVEVPGAVPLLWDDDPAHLVLEYAPVRGRGRSLVVEVYAT